MSILRRFAKGVRGFDDAYSAKIGQMYEDANPVVKAAAYTVGGAHPSFRFAEPEIADGALKTALQYGVPIANAVPKYVLPPAGVTAAGMGLMELVRALSPYQQQPMSQQEAALVEMLASGQITDQEFYQMAQNIPK